MRSSMLQAGLLSLAVAAPMVHAEDGSNAEVAALRAQVQLLQARLEVLEQRLAADAAAASEPVATSSTQPPPTPAATPAAVTQAEAQPAASASTPAPAAVAAAVATAKTGSTDDDQPLRIGGRLHWDAYLFDDSVAGTPSTTELRRARISLQGKAGGWQYKLEQDFAGGNSLDGLRDAWIARELAGGKLTIGHFKPYRGMDELSSSNDNAMQERSFVSASGLFAGRQYQQGAGWLWAGSGQRPVTAGISAFNLRNAGGPRNEGWGAAGRLSWAPLHDADRTVHLGIWGSHEQLGQSSPDLRAESNYASRRGPRRLIAVSSGAGGGDVDALGLELAGSFGPLYLQSEFSRAWFDQVGGPAQAVQAFYVQGAWLFAGGHRPYKTGSGVFGAPQPGAEGLWELTMRYEQAENRDLSEIGTRTAILGINWYLNRHLRFMLDITRGRDQLEGEDARRIGLRSQIVF